MDDILREANDRLAGMFHEFDFKPFVERDGIAYLVHLGPNDKFPVGPKLFETASELVLFVVGACSGFDLGYNEGYADYATVQGEGG